MLASTPLAVVEQDVVPRRAGLAQVRPEPALLGLAPPGVLLLHRGLVALDHVAVLQHPPLHEPQERVRQLGDAVHPPAHAGLVQLESTAAEHLLQPVQRQVVGVLAHRDVGQEPRGGQALGQAFFGSRGGDDLGALAVEVLARPRVDGTHVADHPGLGRDVVDLLADFLADAAERLAGGGVDLLVLGQVVQPLDPRPVGWNRLPLAPLGLAAGGGEGLGLSSVAGGGLVLAVGGEGQGLLVGVDVAFGLLGRDELGEVPDLLLQLGVGVGEFADRLVTLSNRRVTFVEPRLERVDVELVQFFDGHP